MSCPGVQPAKVPASAVPHWEGNGWERCEPPVKPTRILPMSVTPAPVVAALVENQPDPGEDPAKPAVTKPKPKAKAAPTGRNEED